jgi:hypothetical protein
VEKEKEKSWPIEEILKEAITFRTRAEAAEAKIRRVEALTKYFNYTINGEGAHKVSTIEAALKGPTLIEAALKGPTLIDYEVVTGNPYNPRACQDCG